MVLELEWEFNPNVTIVPMAQPIGRHYTPESLEWSMKGVEYIELDHEAQKTIIESFKAKV